MQFLIDSKLRISLALLVIMASTSCMAMPAASVSSGAAKSSASISVLQMPANLDFGPQAPGTSTSRLLTLTNTGSRDVVISGATLSGSTAFGLRGWNGQTTLAPTASLSLAVYFQPTAPGTFTGSIAVTDSRGRSRSVALDGSGVQPLTVSISPSAATLQPAGIQQFAANVSGTSTTTVIWTVNGKQGGDATLGTISSAGLYTAPSNVSSAMNVTVAATSTADTSKQAAATVSVSAPAAPSISANERYLSPNGSDTNDGTYGHPWKTFAKADSAAKPGNVIHVAAGTYTFFPTLTLTSSGTSTAHIQWISDTKGGARIVSSGSTSVWDTAVILKGNYIDFKGFDVTAINTTTLDNGIDLQGSHIRAIGNTVHDIVAPGPQGVGGCGICSSLQLVNGVINSNNQAIGNTVYNIGNPANPSANPRVHGIYWSNHNGYIANNVVHHSMSWGIQLGHAADHCAIINNTVFSNGYGGIVISVSATDNQGIRPDYMFVANNIVYNNGIGYNASGYGIEEYNSPTNLGPNNSYINNLVYQNLPGNWNLMVTGGTGIGTITVAPGFVNWQANGSGDYRLSASSAAIDRGTGTNAPSTDFSGGTRPISGNWDLGAYEYGTNPLSWPW